MGDTWYLDELFVNIQGRQQYLWRAVDEDGDVIDILVQSRRNRHAAVRFFRKLLRSQGRVPRRLIADKLRSYPAACRTVMPSVIHCTDQYANNRAEVSHQATRQRAVVKRRVSIAANSPAMKSLAQTRVCSLLILRTTSSVSDLPPNPFVTGPNQTWLPRPERYWAARPG